ncbi:SIR2 family protein [Sorangium sp. So ce388]|uniref:SIR2 family protein n=1 Tax=Sorangium sp. So ce388 TaxID=3133309 RepID=UPI003F5B4D2B
MTRAERWKRTKRAIEAEFPDHARLLDLPDELPVPRIEPADLGPSLYFTGRGELCARVAARLAQKTSLNIHALSGIGGVGKSEVAKYVALDLQERGTFSDGYIWLSLESAPRESVYAEIAKKFDIFQLSRFTEASEQRAILQAILKATDPLIVLDNADDPDSLAIAYECLRGKTLLITSRQHCAVAVEAEDLEDLDIPAAASLYWTIYTHRTAEPAAARQRYDEALKEIAARLSGHPLSIEIIASIAARFRWAPERTLEELHRKGIRALALPKDEARYKVERHRAIARTFQLALDQDLIGFQGSAPRARLLFAACAALSGEFFYLEEVRPVLEAYVAMFDAEVAKAAAAQAEQEEKRDNPVRVLLGLDPGEPAKRLPEPDSRGVDECRMLLVGSPSFRAVIDELVAANLIKRANVEHDRRARHRFHPLLREYACDLAAQYFTSNIWRAVAQWTERKVQALHRDPGEQIQNFIFVLRVCKERELPEEFATILLAILPFLTAQGMWSHAIELLHLGEGWIRNSAAAATLRPRLLKSLGVLLFRKGDRTAAFEHLKAARTLYSAAGDRKDVAYIDYVMAFGEEDGDAQRISSLKNLRLAAEIADFDTYTGEVRRLCGLLDEDRDAASGAALERVGLELQTAISFNSNVALFLLDMTGRARGRSDLATVRHLLGWATRIQELDYNVGVTSSELEERFFVALQEKDIDGAAAALVAWEKLESSLGRGRAVHVTVASWRAFLDLERGDYAAASASMMEAFAGELAAHGRIRPATCARGLLTSIMHPSGIDPASIRKASDVLDRATRSSDSSADFAFSRGVLAAHAVVSGSGEREGAIVEFRRSLSYLAHHRRSEHRWLALAQAPVIEAVGAERFFTASLRDDAGAVSAVPAHRALPSGLPPLVRSTHDGRVLRLVPAGLTPITTTGKLRGRMVWLPPYYLDVNPVSVEDYLRFIEATGHRAPTWFDNESFRERMMRTPMGGVTLDDAKAYCAWAGKVLPSVLELERAARVRAQAEPCFDAATPLTLGEIDAILQPAHEAALSRVRQSAATNNLDELLGTADDIPESHPYSCRWNEFLPPDVTPGAFLRRPTESEGLGDLLDLLCASLSLDMSMKRAMLEQLAAEVGLNGHARRYLLVDRAARAKLNVRANAAIRELVELRRREWHALSRAHMGLHGPDLGGDADRLLERRTVFDYAPSFQGANGPSPESLLWEGLTAEQKKRAVAFLQGLSTARSISLADKLHTLAQLRDSSISLEDSLLAACDAIQQERCVEASERRPLTVRLAEMQDVWKAWSLVWRRAMGESAPKGTLFKEQGGLIDLFHQTNPFEKMDPWHAGIEAPPPVRRILAPLPGLLEDAFLDVLANCLGMPIQFKARVLLFPAVVPPAVVEEIAAKMAQERATRAAAPRSEWAKLSAAAEARRGEWRALLAEIERIGVLDEHPLSALDSWRVDGADDVLRRVLPEHPATALDEERLLDLLAASLLLGPSEKLAQLDQIPSLDQDEANALLAQLEAERATLASVDRVLWPLLALLRRQARSEWELLVRELAELPASNPYCEIVPWDDGIDEAPAMRRVLPEHPAATFDEQGFLVLLAASGSLEKHIKRTVMASIPRLSQEQIDALIEAFTTERAQFAALGRRHWKQLAELSARRRAEWKELIAEPPPEPPPDSHAVDPRLGDRQNDVNLSRIDFSSLDAPPSGLESHPTARSPACDAFLPPEIDVRRIIPPHPQITFAERQFLQLLAQSISLSKSEKLQILASIPRIDQQQIDEVIGVFLEERARFFTLDERFHPELEKLYNESLDAWAELVLELLPDCSKPVDANAEDFRHLRGDVWHWTSSSAEGSPLVAGGPTVRLTGDDGVAILPAKARDAEGKNTDAYLGFRCCVPIYSKADLANLIPMTATHPTAATGGPKNKLAEFLKKRRPLLWVGAGLSVPAGIPASTELAARLWREHGTAPVPPVGDPYQLIDAFHARYGRGELEAALSHLVPSFAAPTGVHRALARLAKVGAFSAILTTNYDRLLEHVLTEAAIASFVQILDQGQDLRDDGRLRLMKIHGDVAGWRDVVLTGDSYRTFAAKYAHLVAQYSVLLRQNPVLFLGCSMLDERLLSWIEGLNLAGRTSLKHWMVVLTTSERARLGTTHSASGRTALDILAGPNVEILELPDHAALEPCVAGAADELAPASP